ncbi:MAG TPA: hypothetical protein VKB54_02780 [Solirubrobacteraceae bacterium]|nr:hypothetical protein [Solirubrobacteraceae bacterium]
MWPEPSQSNMLFMFNDHLLRTLSNYRADDARRGHNIVEPTVRPKRPRARADEAVTIRHAQPADAEALQRLAALDSRRVPSGELYVAERDGRLAAAVSIDTGAVIADPFEPTAAVVDLLRLHAAAARPQAPLTARVLHPRAQTAAAN